MRIRISLLAALAAVVLLLFPDFTRIILHLMAAGWAGMGFVGIPYHVWEWNRYDRPRSGWPERKPFIKRATISIGLAFFLTVLFWPQYAVWFALLQ